MSDVIMNRLRATAAAGALLLTVIACGEDPPPTRGPLSDVGGAQYITTSDSTRLAVDVYLPTEGSGPFPTLLTLTRYRRGLENPQTGAPIPTLSDLDRYLRAAGYALVKVDARGSGASFGTRPVEYGRQEVLDAYDVVDWVVEQDWSDETVGAYGTSYTGTTAELLAAVNHPAVRAVIPGWSDFDVYRSPVRPYGLAARGFISTWSDLVGAMDRNDTEAMGASVRRADEDRNGELLAQAVAEHDANPDVYGAVLAAEYRDDVVGGGETWAATGPLHWQEAIERSGIPMLVLVSWLDAGTADGTIHRFQHFSNPQNVVALASTHGGGFHASPYTVSGEPLPPRPSQQAQFELRRLFFDHHLKGEENGVAEWPPFRFFNLGEEAFHDTESWPPSGTTARTFHLDAQGVLRGGAESVAPGADVYLADREVTTGSNNRWMAQMGEPILNLDDRRDMDRRMLTYTTPPLTSDVQIAGHPVVSLQLSSDRRDGSLFVYLEDVDPEGRSRYVTEGGLRLVHRATAPSPWGDSNEPYRTFARADAAPMPPDSVVTVELRMWPIAALIRAGHRIRLAIAGADAGMFDLLPAEGEVTLTVHRGGDAPSFLRLPVVRGGLGPASDDAPWFSPGDGTP